MSRPSFPVSMNLSLALTRSGVLFLTVPNPGPALSIDVDGEVWLRIVPATKQIVGFEIEDFKRSLLKHHPDLAAEWYDPPIGSGSHEDREWHPERFVELAVCCLSQSLAARPVQLAPYT